MQVRRTQATAGLSLQDFYRTAPDEKRKARRADDPDAANQSWEQDRNDFSEPRANHDPGTAIHNAPHIKQ
jgi:hypothetical protein